MTFQGSAFFWFCVFPQNLINQPHCPPKQTQVRKCCQCTLTLLEWQEKQLVCSVDHSVLIPAKQIQIKPVYKNNECANDKVFPWLCPFFCIVYMHVCCPGKPGHSFQPCAERNQLCHWYKQFMQVSWRKGKQSESAMKNLEMGMVLPRPQNCTTYPKVRCYQYNRQFTLFLMSKTSVWKLWTQPFQIPV